MLILPHCRIILTIFKKHFVFHICLNKEQYFFGSLSIINVIEFLKIPICIVETHRLSFYTFLCQKYL